MWNLNRMRKTAGNICLVLFIAFLFTIIVGPYAMVGSAEAGVAVVEKNSSNQWVGVTSKGITTNQDGSYQLLLNLAVPLTDTDFNSLELAFDYGSGKVISVYAKDIIQGSVYDTTYGKVYSLVYSPTAEFKYPVYNQVYGKVYVGSTSLYSVLLTLNPPPPSGSGGSSGSTVNNDVKLETSTGQYTQTGNTASLDADSNKLNTQINSTQPVVIELPANSTATEVKVNLPANIFNTLMERNKDLTIKTNDVQFVIPPAALDVKALTDLVKADPNTKITLDIKVVTPASVQLADKIGKPENANLKAVGKVFDFGLIAKSASAETRISSFSKKLKVAIPYTDGDLAGLKEESLGAYRVTVNGLVFLGGDVDKEKNLVWFETESFSNYTLMAKVAAFADIMGHWAKNDIERLVDKAIVKGVSANSFAPESSITRAQFAALLVRALGLAEVKTAAATFKDVKSSAWYYGVVESAAAKGLVTGYNGSFNPEGKITRQEMAVMIARSLKIGGKTVTLAPQEAAQQLSKFSDRQQIASWAQEGVAVAAKEKVVNGRTPSTYVAKANATRAEGTVMIKRVLDNLGKL